jgi:2,3-bisphosphoglycerate-dependent phosphoglycerate mutase
MKDLWLIRHAESLANIGESTSTPREIPLSENGLRQADELAAAITERPDLVILSPYIRSRQTAEPFFELYPDVATETLFVQEFTYLSVSRCRGTSYEQRKPWVDEYWQRADPNYCDGDQAESFAEFIGRCERFARQMLEREFELAFVFTHEQFIKGLLWNSMKFGREMTSDSMKAFQKFMISFSIPNTSIVRIKVDDDGNLYFGKIDITHTEKHA